MAFGTLYAAAHARPHGPGDARPTALQIVADEHQEGKLMDRVVLVTGGSAGIGLEAATAMAATGARVFVTCRDLTKGQQAVDNIKAERPEARLELLELDLGDLDSVRACAKAFLARTQQLNILMLNAGVLVPPKGRTKQGFELQFGSNHLAHFLLFELLKPALLASASAASPSRVVMTAAGAHRAGQVSLDDYNFEHTAYEPMVAYGRSKHANILFASELDRLYGDQDLFACSLNPGGAMTDGVRAHVAPGLMEKFETDPAVRAVFKTSAQAAATQVLAALTPELAAIRGRYLENCAVAPPADSNKMGVPGYHPWAYDPPLAAKLWELSLKLVGLS